MKGKEKKKKKKKKHYACVVLHRCELEVLGKGGLILCPRENVARVVVGMGRTLVFVCLLSSFVWFNMRSVRSGLTI
jgi:hypothetical protein